MCFVQCMIKQLLDSVCDIQNNQGLGKGYQPQSSASADDHYLDLDYSGYHKNLIQQLFNILHVSFALLCLMATVAQISKSQLLNLFNSNTLYSA